MADYARALGYDARTLTRATRAATGTGAKAFLDQRILLEARRLLAHTDLPVTGCARRLGFRDAGNFTTFFRRQAAMPPAAWRTAYGIQEDHDSRGQLPAERRNSQVTVPPRRG